MEWTGEQDSKYLPSATWQYIRQSISSNDDELVCRDPFNLSPTAEDHVHAIAFVTRFIDERAVLERMLGLVDELRRTLNERGVGLVLVLTDISKCRRVAGREKPDPQLCRKHFAEMMHASMDEVVILNDERDEERMQLLAKREAFEGLGTVEDEAAMTGGVYLHPEQIEKLLMALEVSALPFFYQRGCVKYVQTTAAGSIVSILSLLYHVFATIFTILWVVVTWLLYGVLQILSMLLYIVSGGEPPF
eukprot:SAG11_NODE_1246_length_5402_cov_1.972468_3_plen_247_part_00